MSFTPNEGLIEIGTVEGGWTLYYDATATGGYSPDCYVAKKGRKTRKGSNRSTVIGECIDEDAKTARRKVRKAPCVFRYWDPEREIDREVELTSYSSKGIAIKDASGTSFLKTCRLRSNRTEGIGVVTGDTKRLLTAVEMLRRAEAELAAAEKEAVTIVKINAPSYGGRTSEYHAEEDRLREQINSLTESKDD